MLSWFADAASLWRLDQQLVRDVNVNLHQTWLDPIFFVVSSTGLGWVQVILILCFFPWRTLISHPQPPPSKTSHFEGWGSEATSPPNPLSSASHPDKSGFRKLNNRGGIVGLLNAEHVHITVPLLISWAVTGIVDTLIKHDVPRERPSNLAWSLPQESIYANSFASGHTATSFGLAFTVLFLTWNSPKRKWGILALVWACLVGFSRVYRGVHWPSDVVSGFFVGLGCAAALMVVYPERFKCRDSSAKPQVSSVKC